MGVSSGFGGWVGGALDCVGLFVGDGECPSMGMLVICCCNTRIVVVFVCGAGGWMADA